MNVKTNTVVRFFEEAIEITNDPKDTLSSETLKNEYFTFCHNKKITPMPYHRMLANIREIYPEVQYKHMAKSRRWTYVKLRV